MKININGKKIELKYSFRSMMIYEKILGTSFDPKGMTEVMVYFYSTLIASDKTLELDFDGFMDWLDANPKAIQQFTEWLTTVLQKNAYINGKQEKTEVEPKKA